jgi:signal transduction histidine kinase
MEARNMNSEAQVGRQTNIQSGPWHTSPAHQHLVQFYESEDYLLFMLSQFVTTTLTNDEAGIVVVTQDHLERLESILRTNGIDVERCKESGQFTPVSTSGIMPKFMIAGEPDPVLFRELFGTLIQNIRDEWPSVRIFGEMVALTAELNYATATVDLENLWNELLAEHDFSLCCAYPIQTFRDSETAGMLQEICEQHSAVFPAESYSSLASDSERFREVAMLQQKATQLEFEVQERARAQQQLSEALEAERTARQEAEAALRIRDEFVSIAAHELKTPLTSLIGRAQLAQRRVQAREQIDRDTVGRLIESVVGQADKLSRLISQLLDVSRLRGGKLTIERETVDLVELINESINSVHVSTNSHTISIETPETMIIEADPIRMEQVIINLINNAVKYSPPGSKVTVSLDWPEHNAIEISVQDEGPGIPAADRGQIFDRFYQAGNQSVHNGGMGLGLYICREIVELHGGDVLAEFPDHGGTRIVVRLPLSSARLVEAAN